MHIEMRPFLSYPFFFFLKRVSRQTEQLAAECVYVCLCVQYVCMCVRGRGGEGGGGLHV